MNKPIPIHLTNLILFILFYLHYLDLLINSHIILFLNNL